MQMSTPENPYASPALESGPPPIPTATDEAELIRRRYLKHETSVRSIGVLYYLAALILAVGTASIVLVFLSGEVGPAEFLIYFLISATAMALAVYGGRALRKLSPSHPYRSESCRGLGCFTSQSER